MAILITGGAGYIGSHTCVELLNAGKDIVILDNFSNSNPEVLERIKKITGRDFAFHKADLLNADEVEKVFSEHKIDSVIHFAGLKAVGESVAQPLRYYSHNLNSTFNLVSAMRKYGCGKLVFSSSATVYGNSNPSPVSEKGKLGPTSNPYGETKLMQERILSDLFRAGDIHSLVILRYFNPIGAHESGMIGEDPNGIPNNLFPYITQVAVGKLPYLSVFGDDYPTPDGTGIRDYIHVVDLAKAHLRAIEYADTAEKISIFNLGTGTGYSVYDMIRAFEKTTGKKVPYKVTSRRSGDIAVSFADPSLAEKVLGWKAEKGIEQMCADAYRWQSMNPDGYGKRQ